MQARSLKLADTFILSHNGVMIDVNVVTRELKYPTYCRDGTDGCMYETIVSLTPLQA